MTQSHSPQSPQSPLPPSGPEGGDRSEAPALPPPALTSPLAPILAERRRSSILSLLLGLALVVAVGGVAFAAGRVTAPASTAAGAGGGGRGGFGGGNGFTPGASGEPGNGLAGGGVRRGADVTLSGTVEAITPASLSLKLASGTTIEIPIDTSTTYHGQSAAASTDVKTGAQVQVEMNGFGRRQGVRGAIGPARDITIVTP